MSRACPNIVMATKRTFGGTRKERLAWHLYQLVIMQGVVCPPKLQVLYVRDACKTSRGCMD